MTEQLFQKLVAEALRLGLIDIFQVISWWYNGTHPDQVVQMIREQADKMPRHN